MTLDLFRYEDDDGDELILRPSFEHPGQMMFHIDHEGVRQSVRASRDKALRVYSALGEWLFPGLRTEAPSAPDSLIDQLVKRAVAEEVARVLPLYLAPFAIAGPSMRCSRCGASPDGDHENCAGDVRACHYIGPKDAGYAFLADPEPHDVGIVDEPAEHAATGGCDCGHRWGYHGGRKCHAVSGCGCVRPVQADIIREQHDAVWETAPKPRLMAEVKPVRDIELPGTCPECGHSMKMHPPGFGVDYCVQFTNAVVCGCKASAQ